MIKTKPTKTVLIGFHGRAGSGKDTLAAELHEMLAPNCCKLSFARPMKSMLEAIGFDEPKTQAEKAAPIPGFDFTWREAAQWLGTEWGRHLDPNLWVKLARGRCIEGYYNIFTDVRFPNEAEMILREGGVVIGLTGRAHDMGDHSNHSSETPLPDRLVSFWHDNSLPVNDSFAILTPRIFEVLENQA